MIIILVNLQHSVFCKYCPVPHDEDDQGVHAPDAAPEVLLGEPARLASDIFSFGVLLHEVATSKPGAPSDKIDSQASIGVSVSTGPRDWFKFSSLILLDQLCMCSTCQANDI